MRWQLLIPNMVILDFKARGPSRGVGLRRFCFWPAPASALADEPPNPDLRRPRGGGIIAPGRRYQFQRTPMTPPPRWQFARACFNFADFVTNETQRAALARQGIAACQQWLGARTRFRAGALLSGHELRPAGPAEAPSLAAYRLVREMEREFKTAAELDGHFDYAGPERSLGLLYRDAPGWPLSIGSRHKAREWLEQADETRAGLSRKSFEPGRIPSAVARTRRGRTRIEGARRPLAGRAHQSDRPGLGTQLGGLVGATRGRAKKSRRNFQAGGVIEKLSLEISVPARWPEFFVGGDGPGELDVFSESGVGRPVGYIMAKRLLATLTDTTLFLQEWLANPQRTGSVVPSSRKLAAAMAHWLPADPESYVLELGPGTGAVTQALLAHGLREERLVAIERNPKLARPAPRTFSPRPHHHRRRVAIGRFAAPPPTAD